MIFHVNLTRSNAHVASEGSVSRNRGSIAAVHPVKAQSPTTVAKARCREENRTAGGIETTLPVHLVAIEVEALAGPVFGHGLARRIDLGTVADPGAVENRGSVI